MIGEMRVHAVMGRMKRRGAAMGLGMQIVYLGFVGSAAIEAEAGVQLLRLERYSGVLQACHLAIESMHITGPVQTYDVRLDLLMAATGLKPIVHCSGDDPLVAIRQAFDAAERELQLAGTSRYAVHSGPARRGH
ncbi:hypothetical protein FHX57_006945 [Paraburkholderia tropica]|uniref:Metal ABC transporter ATPase n=2 Tax=Burkholderiaceae TaxID=119060 RepID=A0AAQ1GNM3_9BURK|nr:hypothetical protein [Paraburkholderia tropica]MBB3004562.1 hypothetical protein [Paraburkholderia tropica]MBB6323657.1 hypothetical protein [Paraburkholderia tropica]PXX06440.1 hypothetical protein C7400_13543 [Paraburkholderia tropica]PZW72174.1 hypothetical protein C7399_13543 [Paraburkholderia tropica]